MCKKTDFAAHIALSVFLLASVALSGCAGPKTVSAPSGQEKEIPTAAATDSDDLILEDTTAEEESAASGILEDTDAFSSTETAVPDEGKTGAAAQTAAGTDSEIPEADEGVLTDSSDSSAGGETSGDQSTSETAFQYWIPSRDEAGPDTALKESQLSLALVKCTGWGGSAGSSLSAALSATKLIAWSGDAAAGSADADLLKKTVTAEFERLSVDQQENLKENWPSIRYDARQILEDFDSFSPLLEDAGCLEEAKAASSAPNAAKNWKAAEKVLDGILN